MQQLEKLYAEWCGHAPVKSEPLAKAGSNRHYFRLADADGKTVIGVVGTSVVENHSFIYLARHFSALGLPVPAILAVSDDEMCYLQDDLGTLSLYDALASARQNDYTYTAADRELLQRTIRLLPHVQVEGAVQLDFSQCIPPLQFGQRAAMFDLNYFKYSFLKTTDIPFDEERLEDDLQQFAADLSCGGDEACQFLYRDFQARNIMLRSNPDGGAPLPCFIDFQGGMKGPVYYDVASFLFQASARYPRELREWLEEEYVDELSQVLQRPVDVDAFRQRLSLFVLFRVLQVLGAYGLRGYVERKTYFLQSIPPAINNLRELLDKGVCAPYPYFERTLRRMCALPQFSPVVRKEDKAEESAESAPKLVVRIFSFSYKKGIPADESGNGGGYVFDCRSTHNPGRYEPYKHLTGLDAPVIRFLEENGEITVFLESVLRLADAHVARYIERGFTDLMFSFGCTGGQHRSVYSAQHLAEHLSRKFGIEVRLVHREQGISQIFPARSESKA